MSVFGKILRGEGSERPTRFHDSKGTWALTSLADAADAGYSLATMTLRIATGYRPAVPWICRSALRFIKRRLPRDARIFEWGCGMSTLYYTANYGETHGVEDNRAWFEIVSKRVKPGVVQYAAGREYVEAIHAFPDAYFGMIVIDGSQRLACYREALRHLRPGGLVVIDNSDADQHDRGDMYQIDRLLEQEPSLEVHRFAGWAPGNFFAQETTVCVHRG